MIVQRSSPVLGILRYSAGNVGSVKRALARLGIPSRIVEEAQDLRELSGLIVPGAGAAKAAMDRLQERGLVERLRAFDRPFLGLCLGMQLLFESSEEGPTDCLGIIKGTVRELPDTVTKPHMGWNMLRPFDSAQGRQAQHDSPIGYSYFVHSYSCVPSDPGVTTMTVQYGTELCAGVRQGNFFGLQWHPEKSGVIGDRYLLSFADLCK